MTMAEQAQFAGLSRLLHWTMAILVLAMLFIGIAMVASLEDYHLLVSVHKPLGILILILVIVRLINRWLINPPPPLPADMPNWDRSAANASIFALYAFMFALPLVGWGMLSAAGYPIVLYGPLCLPPILPADPEIYAVLRKTHTVLAFLLFATFIAHFSGVMMHALIFRDGLFESMASVKTRASENSPPQLDRRE
jgi:cytochrome b561